MTTSAERPSDREAELAADDAQGRLSDAGFPQTAINAWWMLYKDPTLKRTPHRIWEAGDFEALKRVVDKTIRHHDKYQKLLEELVSEEFAARLKQSAAVRARLHRSIFE